MTGHQEIFQQHLNEGHSAAWEQSWEQAVIFYRQALAEVPDDPGALTSLGLALFELERYDESLEMYVRSARQKPDDPLPVEKISQIFERQGDKGRARSAALQAAELYLKSRDINKAIENWQRVTHFQPDNLQAHTRLALVFERLGRKNDAVMEYLALASLFQHRGEVGKAGQAVQQALQIMPSSPEAMEALSKLSSGESIAVPTRKPGTGSLRRTSPKMAEPEPTTRPAANVDPISDARQRALAEVAGVLFEITDDEFRDQPSRKGFQSLVRGSADNAPRSVDHLRIQLHLSQMIELQTNQKMDQAAVELERAIEAGLEYTAAYFSLGYLYFQSGVYEKAIRYLRNAVQNHVYEIAGRLLLGRAYRKLDRLAEAVSEYLGALGAADTLLLPAEQAEDLRSLYDHIIEGQAQQHLDDAQQQRICENIDNLFSQPGWLDDLKRSREQLGPPEDDNTPIPLAEVILQSRSSKVVESLARIRQLDQAGHIRSAMEEAYLALAYAPSYLPLHAYMAELLLKQGLVNMALDKYIVVAQTYSSRGEARRAMQIYRRVVTMAPMDLSARLRLIEQLKAMGQADEALAEYMSLSEIYYSLANLEEARKVYEEALKTAQHSRSQRTWQVRILHRIADVDLQSLDWRSALRVYEQIRNMDPDDEKARMNLVNINSRLGQDTRALSELDNYILYLGNSRQAEKAVKFLQTLVREDPTRSWVRRRYAYTLQSLGRKDEAIEQLDALGEILIDSGDIPGAIQAIQSLLALKPPRAEDYQRLLDQLKSQAQK